MASYHRGGIDWDILGMVAATTRAGTHPFILYGDFNATPAELEASGFPSTVDAVVYHSNIYSCELDGVRSNIDFFLVSRTLVPLLDKLQVIRPVPFGPHFWPGDHS